MANVIDKNGCVYRENDKRVKKNPEKFRPTRLKEGKCYRKEKRIN